MHRIALHWKQSDEKVCQLAPFSVATDAFQIPWTEEQSYAFPPFALLPTEDTSRGLHSCVGGTNLEYSTLVSGTITTANTRAHHPTVFLTDPFNQVHPLMVVAWKVSGNSTL